MAVVEKSGLLKYKDKSGNIYLMLPITNTDNVDGLDEMIDEAKVVGTAVAATSTDGVAYTATVPGVTALTAGDSFIMVPDKLSTSRSTTLNVNNLGAKYLRVRVSGYSGTTSSAMTANWLSPNKPVRVTYDGTWWIAEVVLPSAQQLYGNVPADDVTYSNTNSGMTADDVQSAIDELAGSKTSTQVLTTTEYDALEAKDETVLYMLSDAEDEDNAVRYIENTVSVVLPTVARWRSVCYGNDKFVAVAYTGDDNFSSYSNVSAYSTDGVTWTKATLPTTANWYSVCYDNGKFVAVASDGSIAAYSTDGVTWTQTTLPASTMWSSVCYGNNKFVAVSFNTSDVAAYSTDGITWTQTAMPASANWRSVCYGDGKFVAIADETVAYSTDGITWTQTTLPDNISAGESVCYGNGMFVTSSYYSFYSSDGITWHRPETLIYTNWRSVCYGNGKFVKVADDGSTAAYSIDGITWTQTTLPTDANWISVCYGNGKFVVVANSKIGSAKTNFAAYSTDGINWTNEVTTRALQNSSGEDISEDVKSALDISADDVGADAKGSAAKALTDAKAYADESSNNTLLSAQTYADDVGADAKAYADESSNNTFLSAQIYADKTKAPAYTYGTSDLTAGTSSLKTGELYFVYE